MEKRIDLTMPNGMAKLNYYISIGWTVDYLGLSLAVVVKK